MSILKNPVMQLDKNISVGNLISWVLILAGLIISYTKLQIGAEAAQARADEAFAKAYSGEVQISELKISIARLEVTAKSIDQKVDEIRRYQKLAINE
jgi:hypothetical protein